jgi:hypothetical protein
MGREDEIKILAYRLWEEDGCCHGRDVEHWTRAEIIWDEQNKVPETPKTSSNAKAGPSRQSKPKPKINRHKTAKSSKGSRR